MHIPPVYSAASEGTILVAADPTDAITATVEQGESLQAPARNLWSTLDTVLTKLLDVVAQYPAYVLLTLLACVFLGVVIWKYLDYRVKQRELVLQEKRETAQAQREAAALEEQRLIRQTQDPGIPATFVVKMMEEFTTSTNQMNELVAATHEAMAKLTTTVDTNNDLLQHLGNNIYSLTVFLQQHGYRGLDTSAAAAE